MKEADAAHQRSRELLLLRATLTILFLLVGMSMWIVLSKGVSTEEGKLAFGALTTLTGSLLGYFTGKTSK